MLAAALLLLLPPAAGLHVLLLWLLRLWLLPSAPPL